MTIPAAVGANAQPCRKADTCCYALTRQARARPDAGWERSAGTRATWSALARPAPIASRLKPQRLPTGGGSFHLVMPIEKEVRECPVRVVLRTLSRGGLTYVKDRHRDGRRSVGRCQRLDELTDSASVVPRGRDHRNHELIQVVLVINRSLEGPILGRPWVLRQSPEAIDTPRLNLLLSEIVTRQDRLGQPRLDPQEQGEIRPVGKDTREAVHHDLIEV